MKNCNYAGQRYTFRTHFEYLVYSDKINAFSQNLLYRLIRNVYLSIGIILFRDIKISEQLGDYKIIFYWYRKRSLE